MNDSLLMDGGYEDSSINLKKVMFWPDNILELFTEYNVRREFDLLSVDMDSYDWWILEKILIGGYRPRVIGILPILLFKFAYVRYVFSVTEYNSMISFNESKAILPPEDNKSWKLWDGTRYHVIVMRGCDISKGKYILRVPQFWRSSI